MSITITTEYDGPLAERHPYEGGFHRWTVTGTGGTEAVTRVVHVTDSAMALDDRIEGGVAAAIRDRISRDLADDDDWAAYFTQEPPLIITSADF